MQMDRIGKEVLARDAEQVVGSHIHHQKFALFRKSKSIFTRSQAASLDLQLHFRDQKPLVFSLHVTGIARSIHQSSQYQLPICAAETARIAQLHRS